MATLTLRAQVYGLWKMRMYAQWVTFTGYIPFVRWDKEKCIKKATGMITFQAFTGNNPIGKRMKL